MTDKPLVPIDLIEEFEKGGVLLFVGEGVTYDSLPSSHQLATELAARCSYPPSAPVTLPMVAGYYELTRNDRNGLVRFLQDRLDPPDLNIPRACHLVAQLRPPIIITTCYDRLLERALSAAGAPYRSVVDNADLAYTDDRKVTLVRLRGALERPESVIVTEDDHRLFLDRRANLSDMLKGELARHTWLFIGFDAGDEWFRSFFDGVSRSLDRHSRRSYIVGTDLGEYSRAWWQKRNVAVLNDRPEAFLGSLVTELGQRRRRTAALGPATAPAPAGPLPEQPYKYLDYYEAKDAALFFGRERETRTLSALIHAHRLVLLHGASGTGKTSLLLAGVAPRLEAALSPYAVIYVRALDDPSAVIRQAVRRRLPGADLPATLPLPDFFVAASQLIGRPIVILLDQFEEFFIRLTAAARQAFIVELGSLYDAQDVPAKIIISLREDWLAAVGEIEERIPEIFRLRFRLLPLTPEMARLSITGPAERVGVRYEPDLVERLLNDLSVHAREQVPPPQLQIVCSTLYEHVAEGQTLIPRSLYDELGGARGILHRYRENELAILSPGERALARNLLEEMVTVQRTKAVKTQSDLALALNASELEVGLLLEKLVRARLLRVVEQPDFSVAHELAHEYLIDEIEMSPEVQKRKQVEDAIRLEVQSWRRMGTLIAPDKLATIAEVRGSLHLRLSELELLFRSALRSNSDVAAWTARAAAAGLPVLEAALVELASDDFRRRASGVTALGQLGDVGLEALGRALADAYPQVRVAAIRALIALDTPEARRTLEQRLRFECYVPAGSFMMGADVETQASLSYSVDGASLIAGVNEGPARQVALAGYFIDKYPVTNAGYACFLADNRSHPRPAHWLNGLPPRGAEDHPVTHVTWFDAHAYARWAGKRLPSEAEWEKAARGTDGRVFPWGTTFKLDRCNTLEGGMGRTTPVGRYSPDGDSPYGAAAMSGNVWEWTDDWYDPDLYRSASPDATNVSPPQGAEKTLRGGSFRYGQDRATTYSRFSRSPSLKSDDFGFRCVA